MNIGVVIPVGPDRLENLAEVLTRLEAQTVKPVAVVVVCDGFPAPTNVTGMSIPLVVGETPKHEPGREQPRNIGVRWLRQARESGELEFPEPSHVWFLDSDVIVADDCLEEIINAYEALPDLLDRIMVCPYDWLGGEYREPDEGLRNDGRWPSFEQYGPEDVRREDLAAGLACFSGNLVWPINEFERVGGFWNELHHGRCEDGELGVRAVAMGVPISFAALARGWHLLHPVNMEVAVRRNTRDVPMLDARHPWIQGSDVFVVDRDGKRFEVVCGYCGTTVNTLEWWNHAKDCSGDLNLKVQGLEEAKPA